MWKFIIDALLIYLLYKIIFEIIIPVSKGVKTVKQNMEQVQRQQAEAFKRAQQAANPTNSNNTQSNNASTTPKKGAVIDAEYIDFEEVKK